MLISRWYHKPRLHIPSHEVEKKPNWLELFYDLIYVAAIIQLGNGLSHHISFVGFLEFSALFFVLWYTWSAFTFYHNRYNVDDALQRVLVFGQMFSIGGMAVSVSGVFEGDYLVFIASYAIARLVIVLMHTRVWLSGGPSAKAARQYSLIWGLGVILWLSSLLLPAPWVYIIWTLAVIIDFSVQFNQHATELRANFPIDGSHLTERFGLLTIIVLGEMFVKVLTEVSEKGANPNMLMTAALGLGITCSLWWLYFDDIAGSRIKKGSLAAFSWFYLHLPLMLSITAVGVAIKKAVFFEPGIVAPTKYRIFLCVMLGLALLSMAWIDQVSERTHALLKDIQRVRARMAGAIIVGLLAFAGSYMPALAFLALVTGACIVQVLFDLAMAPRRFATELDHDYHLFGSASNEEHKAPDDRAARPRRKTFKTAIRLGIPDSFRSDLYVHLIEGSWKQLFGLAAILYLFLNIIFASLYLLQPAGISNSSSLAFLDAFAFSIQTFSTIGYGAMTPSTPFAHTLVTIEAFIGLFWVALVTGIVFAKAASPKASILFSKVGIIKMHEGKRTFMVRLANARGGTIGNGKVSINVLTEKITQEGEGFRSLQEMKLIRDHNPIFPLSWTVFHVIDENSPLYGVTPENIYDRIIFITVSFSGHAEAYANAIYKTYIYHSDAILFDRQFVHVLNQEPGEEIILNLNRFHETAPLTNDAKKSKKPE